MQIINLLKKKREFISYAVFGVLSMLLNIGLFQFLMFGKMDYKIANLITIIVVKIFVYITNKIWVFQHQTDSLWALLKEMFNYILARGFTGLLDYLGMILMVEIFNVNKLYSKIGLQIVVILLNYIFSKKVVFKEIRNQ